MLKIFQISINKNVIRDVQPSNHSITSKELQQMYLSENDYIGKCSCIVCREIKSKKGIHTHYHISHTEFGKIQHKEKSRIAAQASGKATQKSFKNYIHLILNIANNAMKLFHVQVMVNNFVPNHARLNGAILTELEPKNLDLVAHIATNPWILLEKSFAITSVRVRQE